MTRRDLALLFPPLAILHSGKIPYNGNEIKKGRKFLQEKTHTGFQIEMHETILGPGTESHPPHKHEHEEILLIFEGTLETHVEGKTELAESGSIVYLKSNELHNARNNGTGPCRYYVIELLGNESYRE